MSAELDKRLRALSRDQLAKLSTQLLMAIENDRNADLLILPEEVTAARERDVATLKKAAQNVNAEPLVAGDTGSSAEIDLLTAVAQASPDAAAVIDKALGSVEEEAVTLPVLGGLEIVLIAIAAAIVRPNFEFEKDRSKVKVRFSVEGSKDIASLIRAVARLSPSVFQS